MFEIESQSDLSKRKRRLNWKNWKHHCIRWFRVLKRQKFIIFVFIILFLLATIAISNVNASTNEKIVLGVLVPYTKVDSELVFELFSRWDKMSPCSRIKDRPVLSLYQNKRRDVAFETKFKKRIEEYDSVKCFQSIQFDYADLTPEQDIYPFGPSFMFWRFMLLRKGTSFSKLNPSCVLLLEPDTYPVRENFLSRFVEQCRDQMDDTWMLGSLPRRLPHDSSPIQTGSNLAYRFHLNGNALYNYENKDFRKFLRHVFNWIVERGFSNSDAYDTDIASYLLANEHWLETQNIYHKFRASDMIRNYWHSRMALHPDEIRASSDQVVLVHYSRERDTLHTINNVPVKDGGNVVQWSEFEPTVKCRPNSLRVFGENDGKKMLCGFRDMLLEKIDPLVIYSFGSNNEDSFERAILEECDAVGKVCIVSTFDPTSEPPPKSLQLETYVVFEREAREFQSYHVFVFTRIAHSSYHKIT